MAKKLRVPIGIDKFEKIRKNDFYYVDKTEFLVDILNEWSEVNLITRPRRFGKSLNMGMLRSFLEFGCEPELFDGLKVRQYQDICDKYMGKWPVVSISLKSVDGKDFKSASTELCKTIAEEAEKFHFLCDSDKLSSNDKKKYKTLINYTDSGYFMSDTVLKGSLKTLTELLFKHYEKQVIVLIDEYDVPLDKANQKGYYSDMVEFIRSLFEQALKENDYLYFAVLTGCLRVSKESIFTGFNNFAVYSITDVKYSKYFGFTNDEVRSMLEYYDLSEHFDTMKQWYDGYKFGGQEIYCPWDVINYCDALLNDKEAQPQPYWINTSSNEIIDRFIDKATETTKEEIESLMAGEILTKEVHQELTYSEIYSKIDNLWSMLFMTGYLTQRGKPSGRNLQLVIPNEEIREIFKIKIYDWFKNTTVQNSTKLNEFCNALKNGDSSTAEIKFTEFLKKTISIRDTYVQKDKKENFYHGILLGMLSFKDTWSIKSNIESGDGYSDILIKIPQDEIGIVIEVKYGENADMESGCKDAIKQIQKMNYDERLIDDGMTTIYKYGIACYKKRCKVKLAE